MLNSMTRRDTTHRRICFKALLGIPFEPGALPILRPWMVPGTSGVSVNLGLLAGANKYGHHLVIHLNDYWYQRFVYRLKQPLDSLQGVRLSENLREQFPPYDHGRQGNGNSHHLYSCLPQWLVPRNKIFQHGAPVIVPPFLLVVTDLCGWLTLAFRAWSLAICHWLLQAYFILNTNHYQGPQVFTIWQYLRVDSAIAFKVRSTAARHARWWPPHSVERNWRQWRLVLWTWIIICGIIRSSYLWSITLQPEWRLLAGPVLLKQILKLC
jgi:hypothetical protein